MSSSKKKVDEEEVNTLDEEIAADKGEEEEEEEEKVIQQGETSKDSGHYVSISTVYTDPDTMPERDIEASDKEIIESFDAREYQNQMDKERFNKVGYMVWQSKQLFWRAFRKVGEDADTGKVEWEARDYKYHAITVEEAEKIEKKQGEYDTLLNQWTLFKGGVVNEPLYRAIINRANPVVSDLKQMESDLYNLKFQAYFKEPNMGIIKQLLKVDRRDLVDAAEYRESGVPLSRRRASSRITSESKSGQKINKK